MSEPTKTVMKHNSWPGIDQSIIDFDQVHTVKVLRTKIVETLHKKGIIAYIGVKDGLLSGEIIQFGNFGQKYKVVGPTKKVLPHGGYQYRVKRVDGYSITGTDIEATAVGQVVKIKNRRSFDTMFNQVVALLDSNPK